MVTKLQGYAQCKTEFDATLRKISQMGYGIVLLAHSTSRIEKQADGSEVEIISPDLPKRAAEISNGLCDVIGYIGTEFTNGEKKRWLYTRETPTLFAGSRFKYMPDKVPFSYENLVKAIDDAITKAEKEDGITVTDKPIMVYKEDEILDFDSLMSEARDIWMAKVNAAQTDEEKEDVVRAMSKKVEMVFGRKIKLSEVTEDQVALLNLAVMDLRDM